MPAIGILRYTRAVMKAQPQNGIEFRHNGEALGRVYESGAVEIHEDLPYAAARFWVGRSAWRRAALSRVALRGEFLPRPR